MEINRHRLYKSFGKRTEKQTELFITAQDIVQRLGHPFYSKLNEVLAKIRFDR